MKYTLLTLSAILVGCSSPPKKEDLAYLEHQVYQCKMVCTSGSISNLKIAELGCDCNTKKEATQAPVIIMQQAPTQPIVINNVIPSNGYPVYQNNSTATRAPATIQEEEVPVTPSQGVQVKLGNGRTIYSSAK